MMMLTAAATAFLIACSPGVASQTMAGLIDHESGWQQYAIGDNTTHRSYYPTTYFAAVSIVQQLQKEKHDLDVGLAQINSSANWAAYGLNAYNVFEPCRNVAVGADILGNNYRDALHYYAAGDDALVHALSAYNSGRFTAAMGYAESVIANARGVRFLADPHARFTAPAASRVTVSRIPERSTSPTRTTLVARAQPPAPVRASGEVLQWALPAKSLPVRTARTTEPPQ
jgi:type IV secretion system protein VirB1